MVENSESKNFYENLRSPIRYPGSKFQALRIIYNYIKDIDCDEYWEPFLGGGAFFFAKPIVSLNVLNDIDEDLINFYRIIQNQISRKKLIESVSSFKPTKDNFYSLKSKTYRDDFNKACQYFIINRTCYSGIMKNANWGYDDKRSLQPYKWGERLEKCGTKLQKANLKNLDFRRFFEESKKDNKSVFSFIDPPYYHADQKRAYIRFFTKRDHEDLSEILKNLGKNIKFLLTYDNCQEVKELYKWANIHEESWRYHTANSLKASRKLGKELLITNF